MYNSLSVLHCPTVGNEGVRVSYYIDNFYGTCVYILVVCYIVVCGWDGEVLPNTCSCFVVFTGNFYSHIQFGFDPSYTTDSIQKIKGSRPPIKYSCIYTQMY